MTVVTWTNNVRLGDQTTKIGFDRTDGSRAELKKGQSADLTSDEINRLSAYIILTPGGTPTAPISQPAPVYTDPTTGLVNPALLPSSASSSIQRIDGCSHSGMIGGYKGGSDNSYFKRLAKLLGARKCGWLSAGGSVACWPTANAGTDGGWSWVLNMFQPPNSGDDNGGYMPHTNVAVVQHGAEDLFALGSQRLRPFQEALKTEISRYCTAALFEDSDPSWAYTGTWPAPVTGNYVYSGGGIHYTTTPGSTATWTTPADYPGNLVCAIGLALIGSSGVLTLGLKIDGVDQPDVVLNHDSATGGLTDSENGKNNGIVLRIGRADCGMGIALGPGQHTIALTYKSSAPSGGYLNIDYAQIEADPLDGPAIVLPSGFWRLPSYAGKFTVAQGWKHGSDAAVDPLNDAAVLALIAAQKAVMADFPGRCVYVDIDGVINKNPAMLYTDSVHPSNRGHAAITPACYSALVQSGLLTPRLCSSVGQRSLGAFDGGVWRTIGGVYGTGSNQRPFLNGWTAQSATVNLPMYMIGRLDMRNRTRGIVKQGGAGAANSVMWQSDIGEEPPLGNFIDVPAVVYTGAALGPTGVFRQTDASGTTPRGVFMAAGGVIAAGSFIELGGISWMAEGV